MSIDQYPVGDKVLWMAHYRKHPDGGDMEGPTSKISGTLENAAVEAQKTAVDNDWILQCLRRRY